MQNSVRITNGGNNSPKGELSFGFKRIVEYINVVDNNTVICHLCVSGK